VRTTNERASRSSGFFHQLLLDPCPWNTCHLAAAATRSHAEDRATTPWQQYRNIERPLPFGFTKDDPKQSHGGEFSIHRRMQFSFHSEKVHAAGNESASIIGHPGRVPRSRWSAQRTLLGWAIGRNSLSRRERQDARATTCYTIFYGHSRPAR